MFSTRMPREIWVPNVENNEDGVEKRKEKRLSGDMQKLMEERDISTNMSIDDPDSMKEN